MPITQGVMESWSKRNIGMKVTWKDSAKPLNGIWGFAPAQ